MTTDDTQTPGDAQTDPILTARWWKASALRAVRTFAQTMVALIGTGLAAWHEVPWMLTLSTASVAALLSVVTAVAFGLPEDTSSSGSAGQQTN